MTYQGWTNYETWAVKVDMDNDETAYTYWKERTEEIADDADDRDEAETELASALKAEYEEVIPSLAGWVANLLQGAFDEVNWHEMADTLLEDFAFDDEDEATA